jgi:outer membrane protein
MKRKGLTLLSAAFFLLFSSQGLAQQVWTLQQCIDRALSFNLQVKQSALNTELSKYEVDQSKATMLPTINGFANRSYNYGRSIDPYTNLYTDNQIISNSLGVNSGIVLFDGLQLMNTLKQSKLNYLSTKYAEQKLKDDISLNVVTAYLQVLFAKENLKNMKEQADATKVQRDRTEKMFEAGSLSKANLLDIESQLGLDEVNLANANAEQAQAILTLTQLLELTNPQGFEIEDPNIPAPAAYQMPADANSVYEAALHNQPDIKSYEYKVQSAAKGLSIAKGSRSPRLSMSGSISTATSSSNRQITNTVFGAPDTIGITSAGDPVISTRPSILSYEVVDIPLSEQLNNNIYKTFGFNLSVPIFNGWATRTGVKRAEVNLAQSQLSYEQTKKSLYKSVQQAYIDATSSFQKYGASDKSLKASEEAYRFNDQRYTLGLISSYDYLISKNNLAKAQSSLLQAKYDYIFRIKILDFYQGKPLAF